MELVIFLFSKIEGILRIGEKMELESLNQGIFHGRRKRKV